MPLMFGKYLSREMDWSPCDGTNFAKVCAFVCKKLVFYSSSMVCQAGQVKLRGVGKAAVQAVRPASTTQLAPLRSTSPRGLRLSSEPGARFAHLPVSELAAISTASLAQTASLTVLIVSRPDHRFSHAAPLSLSYIV